MQGQTYTPVPLSDFQWAVRAATMADDGNILTTANSRDDLKSFVV